MGAIDENAKIDELAAKHDLTAALVKEMVYCFSRKELGPDWDGIDLACGELRYSITKALYSQLKSQIEIVSMNPNEELGILGGMNY